MNEHQNRPDDKSSSKKERRRSIPASGPGCTKSYLISTQKAACHVSKIDPDKEYQADQYRIVQLSHAGHCFSANTGPEAETSLEIPEDQAPQDPTDWAVEIESAAGYTSLYDWDTRGHVPILRVLYSPQPASIQARAVLWDGTAIVGLPVMVNHCDGRTTCQTTRDDGTTADETIVCTPCDVVLEFKPSIEHCGRRYACENHRISVPVKPGEDCVIVERTYVPADASLTCRLDWPGRDAFSCEPGIDPSAMVTYEVFDAVKKGEPALRTQTVHAQQDAHFGGLVDGMEVRVRSYSDQLLLPPQPIVLLLEAGQESTFVQPVDSPTGTVEISVRDENGQPVEDVRLTLHLQGATKPGTARKMVTGADGVAKVQNLPFGIYVAQISAQTIDNRNIEPIDQATVTLDVNRTNRRAVGHLAMREELCEIHGFVFQADGSTPIPFAVLEIQDPDGNPDQTCADENGYYCYNTGNRKGVFKVSLVSQCGIPERRYPAHVQSRTQVNVYAGGGPIHPSPIQPTQKVAGEGVRAIEDIQTYPVLTDHRGASSAAAPDGSSASSNLRRTVEGALRNVLGWRVKPDDSKGFQSALRSSFSCENVEGRTICVWNPRTYAVQTDLGAVTGAQASIYTRAKVALDNAVPLLNGLYPLRNDSDEEEIEATRAIVIGTFTELVNELGQEGGPRVERVDSLFETLLDISLVNPTPTPDKVGGQLGRLRDEFFGGNGVNTVQEEQNQTNFDVVVDYITSIRENWIKRRQDFKRSFLLNGNSFVYLGTQLVHISRSLAVVSESVEEVRLALRSVFLDAAEQETTELIFRPRNGLNGDEFLDNPPLFIAELLNWVGRFAAEEGPRLVQDGGKLGVRAFYPTLERLVSLVGQARLTPDQAGDDPHPGNQQRSKVPAGYASPRVQRALQELYEQLTNLDNFARPLRDQVNSGPQV